MKKVFFAILGVAVVMSSCSSYNTATGAYAGAQFGHVIGSAIGGISGGWRGHEMGSLIGTVGGMVAGAAIGSSIDKAKERKYEQRREEVQARSQTQTRRYASEIPSLEIRNAGIFESQRDGVLTRGEECTVVFEIYNTSDHVVYDVRPWVEDITGNKHVNISPNIRVESIAPHKAIRYTATILADSKLKDGEILVRVGVAQGDKDLASQTREFTVPTAKEAR